MDSNIKLVQVILELSQCRSLDAIVKVLRNTTRQLIGADGITIVLRDGDKCFYCEEDAVAALWKGKRFPMSACISGWCMIHAEQVVITDIYADERIPHDAYRPTFVKSLAMTPIRAADPIGSIGAYWAAQHQATDEERRTLKALADSAAMALENAQLIDQLEETGRRKDAFLSMLAHELRNPLAPVRNGLHLLRLQGQNATVVGQAADMIGRQVTHLTRIVDDLLDVSRITNRKVALKRDRVDLTAVVRQCIEDRRGELAAASLSLETDLPSTPTWIDADATRITQVLANVLDNARKYTPAGGVVSVSLRVEAEQSQASIEVWDTGVGIAPEILPHVFESFLQADTSLDRTAGGLGLGLAVAQGLAQLHGGSITAASEGVGHGSSFTIHLPMIPAVTPGASDPKASADASKLCMLIIEDHPDAANSLQQLLRICGFDAHVAYNGRDGVAVARTLRPDVILCDIGLPEMDGYEVTRTLRSSPPTAAARIIAVTGYGSDEDRAKTAAAGFDAHMVKPVDLDKLLAFINVPAASIAV